MGDLLALGGQTYYAVLLLLKSSPPSAHCLGNGVDNPEDQKEGKSSIRQLRFESVEAISGGFCLDSWVSSRLVIRNLQTRKPI